MELCVSGSDSSDLEARTTHVANGNDDSSEEEQVRDMLEYSAIIGKLKSTPRVGWMIRGVPHFESVADHSWRVAGLCFLLPQDKYNISRCLEMAVVHDMAESIVGDITPEDNIPKADKQQLEWHAIQKIGAFLSTQLECTRGNANTGDLLRSSSPSLQTTAPPLLSKSSNRQYLLNLFHEYEERRSPEALAVKDLDQLDMILQAEDYECCHCIDMDDFFRGTPPEKFQTPEIRKLAKEVHQRRQNRLAAKTALFKEQEKTADVLLSVSDESFVESFAAKSTLDPHVIKELVLALRCWEGGKQ